MTALDTAPRTRWSREPALADMLDDPIVAALMTADGIGRRQLEADLGRATARLIVSRRDPRDAEVPA
jgi:hypothetical protein